MFGMFNICKDCILFELILWKKKEEKEETTKRKKLPNLGLNPLTTEYLSKRKKINKTEIVKFGFLNLVKS